MPKPPTPVRKKVRSGPGQDVVADIRARIPRIARVTQHLHFNTAEGLIWLDEHRMILLHAAAFSELRQELIATLGLEAARGLLTRVGYMAGSRDAELAWRLNKASEFDAMAAGAQFHALAGIVQVEPIRVEIDSSQGHCYAEFIWRHSFEGEGHLRAVGVGSEPACWMEVGYSSGFLSAQMGKRILVREIECVAMGHPHCRGIGQPVEKWSDPEQDLRHLRPPAPLRAAALRKAGTTGGPDGQAAGNTARTGGMVGASAAFNAVMHQVHRVAPTHATVLLLGESGVGKSAFARELHESSTRAQKPFVQVNCAAIPETLIESELFGVERGAYSGAVESRGGRFEAAHSGTLFLDEIAMLSLTAQGKLLRVLQTGDMERLGSTRTVKVDVRVVAATNENLQAAIKQGRFREDLFYRLNVFPVLIAPLRDRKQDLPVLLEFYLDKYCRLHRRALNGITPRALQALLAYRWPGNIRELENVVERGVILADDDQSLDVRHLFSVSESVHNDQLLQLSEMGSLVSRKAGDVEHTPGEAMDDQPLAPGDLPSWADRAVGADGLSLDAINDALVRAAVRRTRGNVSRAARMLGLTRAQLDYRLKGLNGQ